MAEHVTELVALSNSRLRSLIIPREHGAWGMLLVPLATGASVGLLAGGRILPLLWLIGAAIAVFWMRTPVESWLGTSPLRAQPDEERSAVVRVILALALVAAVALAGLCWGGQNIHLLPMGAASALAFVVQAGLKKLGRRTRMPAQIVGAMGLTLTAPAAYSVVTGQVDRTALLLWLTNWLFAVNQIHFVQLCIHAARVTGPVQKLTRGHAFLFGQAGVILVLLATWRTGGLPGLVLVAFVPAFLRGIAWFLKQPGPLVVRRLGWTELAHGVAFGILLILGFYVHG